MRRPVEPAPVADRAPRGRPEALSVRDAGDRAEHAYVIIEQEYRERAGGMRLLRQRAQREDRKEGVDAVLPDVCAYDCEVLEGDVSDDVQRRGLSGHTSVYETSR
jgi:hypothetical protein